MPLNSMTGFARADGVHDGLRWSWELKCVNGRNLDIRCRLPLGLDALEQKLRERIGARVRRGSLQIGLHLARGSAETELRLNERALAEVAAALDVARKLVPGADPPRLDGLLAIRGVLEPAEALEDESTRAAREAALLASFDEALGALMEARRGEGEKLKGLIAAHISRIEELAGAAAACAAAQPDAMRVRLRDQVAELLQASNALSDERLEQEAALLIAKADVREEIDRLRAHVSAARALLDEREPVGRRLDFLTQEFHRESNTLCAKSPDLQLSRIGLDLKAAVDQLREQVQNVE